MSEGKLEWRQRHEAECREALEVARAQRWPQFEERLVFVRRALHALLEECGPLTAAQGRRVAEVVAACLKGRIALA